MQIFLQISQIPQNNSTPFLTKNTYKILMMREL